MAAYGGTSVGRLNLRAGAAYAFHTMDTDRAVAFPGFADRLTARYDGGTGQIFGEAGYGFAFGSLAVEPFAGAAWVRLNTDATIERGGVAALAFQSTAAGFVVAGVPIARDSLLAEAGLDLAISRSATIGVSYVGQVARNVQDHAAKGQV